MFGTKDGRYFDPVKAMLQEKVGGKGSGDPEPDVELDNAGSVGDSISDDENGFGSFGGEAGDDEWRPKAFPGVASSSEVSPLADVELYENGDEEGSVAPEIKAKPKRKKLFNKSASSKFEVEPESELLDESATDSAPADESLENPAEEPLSADSLDDVVFAKVDLDDSALDDEGVTLNDSLEKESADLDLKEVIESSEDVKKSDEDVIEQEVAIEVISADNSAEELRDDILPSDDSGDIDHDPFSDFEIINNADDEPSDDGVVGEANSGTKIPDVVSSSTDLTLSEGNKVLQSLEEEQSLKRIPIGLRLIEKGLISQDQLEIALKVQRDDKNTGMIGSILVDLGFITESALGEVLTSDTNIRQFDTRNTIVDSNIIKQVPKDIAEQYNAVPIYMDDESIYIAMTDIYNVLAVDRIQRYFPKRFKIVPVHCSPSDLSSIIEKHYGYELSIDGVLQELEGLKVDDLPAGEEGYTNPTVRLIDALLVDAIRIGASDLHFEPDNGFVRLRYRIDGKLKLIRSFHRDYWSAIVVRIKIMSDINITETRVPQDGRISLNVLGRTVDFRVATQPTVYGENIVMRILDKEKALLPMEALGYSPENVKTLTKALKRPEGVIVVTGPTGSGKTTTLYSILDFVNTTDVNIMTLEDPVEYQLPLIRQSNIRAGTGMDFVGGIKSIMRQDPDIIFIGEIRDEETATMALRAAMTGHQVFTSLHTNDAIGALPRLIDIGVAPPMLSGSIIACLAQRLARKLCSSCKTSYSPDKKECKVMGLDHKKNNELYKKNGCEKCSNTGYKGRISISEIILIDDGLDELIANNSTRAEMMRYVNKNDFIPMQEDGIKKIIEGVTDLEELIRTIDMTDRL